jgi:large subunit ribosomal protein L30
MPSQSSLKITLVKSPIGQKQRQKDTVSALGLRKMHQTVVRPDNPQMRGMVFAIRHLVKVETVDEAPASTKAPDATSVPKGKTE